MTDASLSINVRLDREDFRLDVACDIRLDGVTGLFGPSGAGKSSLLRIIAGLETAATGALSCGGDTWLDSGQRRRVPAWQRAVGYVFQDARLFSHLDVAGNLRYAADRAARRGAAMALPEIVSAFDLEPLLGRRSNTLSGGERQRVAVARALLSSPRLLLLDEPLAALDAGRKGDILPYLEALPARFGIPAIYVSHAIDEVARLADRVVVLDAGKVTASGDGAAILNRVGRQSAGLQFEAATIVDTRLVAHLDELHLTRLQLGDQALVVPRVAHRTVGETVRLHIRAGDVALAIARPAGLSIRNVLEGRLVAVTPHPGTAFATATIDVEGVLLRSRVTRLAVQELALDAGMQVYALLKTASFDDRAPLP